MIATQPTRVVGNILSPAPMADAAPPLLLLKLSLFELVFVKPSFVVAALVLFVELFRLDEAVFRDEFVVLFVFVVVFDVLFVFVVVFLFVVVLFVESFCVVLYICEDARPAPLSDTVLNETIGEYTGASADPEIGRATTIAR